MASVWQTIQTWVFEILHRVRENVKVEVKPLHAAICDNNFSRLKKLLESGQHDINELDKDIYSNGTTPLMVAVIKQGRSPKMAELLVQHDADLSLVDADGWTAVHFAAEIMPERSLLMLKMLLDHGGPPNTVDTFLRMTPLMSAMRSYSLDAVKTLLDAGAALNVVSAKSKLLTRMARQDNEMMKLLREETERRAKQPPTLLNLCKTAIRRDIGCVGLHRKIDQLPLPRELNDELKTAAGAVIFERKPEFLNGADDGDSDDDDDSYEDSDDDSDDDSDEDSDDDNYEDSYYTTADETVSDDDNNDDDDGVYDDDDIIQPSPLH